MEPQMAPQVGDAFTVGTHDRNGAGDHDLPYRFGRRPTTETPFPFSTWELARLLGLRSRVQAGLSVAIAWRSATKWSPTGRCRGRSGNWLPERWHV